MKLLHLFTHKLLSFSTPFLKCSLQRHLGHHHSNDIRVLVDALTHELDGHLSKCHRCLTCSKESSNLSQCNLVLITLHAGNILLWRVPNTSIASRHPHLRRRSLIDFSISLWFGTTINCCIKSSTVKNCLYLGRFRLRTTQIHSCGLGNNGNIMSLHSC